MYNVMKNIGGNRVQYGGLTWKRITPYFLTLLNIPLKQAKFSEVLCLIMYGSLALIRFGPSISNRHFSCVGVLPPLCSCPQSPSPLVDRDG